MRSCLNIRHALDIFSVSSIRLWFSFYISANLFFFLLSSKVSHSSSLSMSEKLAVGS